MATEWISSDIKLTIGILVSNRIGTIRKCMDSLVPLLKNVPSELVALDTVGENTDGSAAVVREYTDRVYRYEWCSDFAHARNTCLSYAKGEWFLFLDDDEWFDHVDDLINFFRSEECNIYHFGSFFIRNYGASGKYSTSVAVRMVRRRTDTRFEGKVHETFHEITYPGKEFQSFLHHSGYAFEDEEAKRKHQERNVSILKKVLETEGKTPRNCAQMAQELLFRNETAEEGYRYCMECLDFFKKSNQMANSCSQWLIVACVRYFHKIKNYEELKRQVDYVVQEYPLGQVTQLALCGVYVNAATEAYDLPKIVDYAERYLTVWDWLEQNPEDRAQQMQLDLPRYYEEEYKIQVLQAAAIAANGLGQFERAYTFWKRFPWKRPETDGSIYHQNLLITLRGMKDKKPLVAYYKHFFKEEYFEEENRVYLPKECREALKEMEKQ